MHDTYYVVAQADGLLPLSFSLSAAALLTLPNSTHYANALTNKDTAINSFRNKRGVYLWTNLINGHQYVGSSKNLGNRLADYYRPSYLNQQAQRGSAISRALLIHGHANFSLSVQVLGPSEEGQVYSPANQPDYVVLEQAYLSSHILTYNVNRTASTAAYNPSTSPMNVGKDNASFGLFGASSYAWGNTHSAELKALWSKLRGKFHFYLYLKDTMELVQHFPSGVQLAGYFEMSKRFGSDIVKMLEGLNMPALVYGKYIISMVELTAEQIKELLPTIPVKEVTVRRAASPTGKTIYGFNPDTNTHQTWSSLEKCTFALTGVPFANKQTVNKRVDKGILFHGYYLQTKPFGE